MPITTTAAGLSLSRCARNSGAPHAEKSTFSIRGAPTASSFSARGAIVRPSPLGYCSVARTGAPSNCAASSRSPTPRVSCSMAAGGIAETRRSCTSMTATRVDDGTSRCIAFSFLSLVEIFLGEHEALDARPGHEPLHDGGDVVRGDAAVEEVVRLDQNGHAPGALVEAARCAGARGDLGEAACTELGFERLMDRFRPFGGAGPLRVVVRAAI